MNSNLNYDVVLLYVYYIVVHIDLVLSLRKQRAMNTELMNECSTHKLTTWQLQFYGYSTLHGRRVCDTPS